ncbi:MAG: D-xylose ABC transporter ATP-binding protein [Cereibacter sphaeroides]|uniref:D-xylose ABC transporter ATP-binding protein n=1 Tax=Cereibacter sphaeroides TaxID=1063 RepID=A0A2W5S263_CERSP|nr:MAG: D-xylose ABC transporter ATP-binding protein [Cereibacter sphaeroides]
MTASILQMRGISKTFGPVKALRDVSLDVRPGELHALMGENGAGKSTLMKILSGAYTADPGGEITFADQPRHGREEGIAVIYQELSLAPNLTVAENMFLGREGPAISMVRRRIMADRAQPVLDRLGVLFSPLTPVGRLSLGERQLVEIARALSSDAKLIVMDEPTTSLSTRETERLFEVIATLKKQGIAIIYISHRMEEVYALADRVSVLRDGIFIGTLERAELSAARLVSMMVGRDLGSFYRKEHGAPPPSGVPLLSVRGLRDEARVRDVSFDLYQGEVLGIAGLVGSGRTEMARLIFGADARSGGEITLAGRPFTARSPREALAQGLAYLTEDRAGLGLFLDMTISDNMNIGVIQRDAHAGGVIDFRRAAQRSAQAIRSLGIKAPSGRVNAGSLSGGNQQKVLLARLLETEPRVIILDEPTRGVDVGAKSEIYKLIDTLVGRGMGVIMISSELPEIIGVADRVLVMREGHIAGEVRGQAGRPISQEEIMALSTGATVAEETAHEQ